MKDEGLRYSIFIILGMSILIDFKFIIHGSGF